MKDTAIDVHATEVQTRMDELEVAKEENLYQNTDEYRSRASSGAMEKRKEDIIEPTIKYIKDHFGLRERRLEGLQQELNKLTLGVDETQFRQDAMNLIKVFCKQDRVIKRKIEGLGEVLLLTQMIEKEKGMVI